MMQRLLAPHEAAILAGDVRVVLCSDLEGDPDELTLRNALAHLVTCYPLLTGRFSTQDGRPLIQVDDQPGEAALGHGASLEEEINAPLTWAQGPLLRITLLREPERTRVVMTLPRSFADGMSYLALHHRFWTIYTALRTGKPVPANVVQPVLGPALDDLLAARFTTEQLHEFVAERARLDATATATVLPALASANGCPGTDLSFRTIQVDVDADRGRALARLAHESSLTTNDLVSGALLTSLRSFLQPRTGPVRMVCTSAVDLRRRLEPPIPDEVLQSAATTTSLRLEVDASATPVDVGRDVHRQLRADLDSDAAAMELAAFSHMIDQHPPTLVITNVGTITEPVLPDGLQVSGVRLAPLGHLPMIFAVVSRYRQRLGINLTYSRAWFTDTQIQDLASRTSTTLDELTQSGANRSCHEG
jgi:NRPS condensation-like uncharacterized protein